MSILHPHWHETPEDQGTAPRGTAPARIVIGRPLWTRRIAALTGCLAVFGLGMLLAHRSEVLLAVTGTTLTQSEEDFLMTQERGLAFEQTIVREVDVRITDDGIVPITIHVHPGDTIVWINASQIPHILESQSLQDASGSTLYTPAIFPEDSERFVLAPNHALGEFRYESTTAVGVEGTVIVEAFAVSSSSSSVQVAEPVPSSSSSSSEPIVMMPEEESSSIAETVDQEALIPVNPYTVGGTPESADLVTQHTPPSTAESGSEIWLIGVLSLGLFAIAIRKLNKSA